MKSINQWLDEYTLSHLNPVNKTIHWLCIPPIVFSVFGMLRALHWGDTLVNGSTLAAVLAVAYYCSLSWRLGLGAAGLFALMGWGVEASYVQLGRLHLPAMIAVFVLAWIGQFIGHKVEGAKPSFFKDLQFLLIGPLWLLAYVYRRIGLPMIGTEHPSRA
jgi:uncharacterized membrane protein YGL010W